MAHLEHIDIPETAFGNLVDNHRTCCRFHSPTNRRTANFHHSGPNESRESFVPCFPPEYGTVYSTNLSDY